MKSTHEARFLIKLMLILMVITSIPAAYGYLTVPDGKWFSGVVYNVHDTAQYFSWMRESEHSIFIENRLTSEPNESIYLNLHWWLAGRFASLINLALPLVYQIIRLASIPLATLTLYLFMVRLFSDRSRRRFAFLLAIFTSGLGWIWVVEKYLITPQTLDFPRDVYTLAGNSLWVMTAAPHLSFALALTLFTLFLALDGQRNKSILLSIAAGLLALFLGMGHIYDLVTVWAILGVFGFLLTLRDGWSWSTFLRLAIVPIISAPSAIYWGWVASDANPIWKQALTQYDNLGVFTPDPVHLIILLGLTFIVALLTFKGIVPLRNQTDDKLLIKTWFGTTLLLIYLPVRFRIMLLTGYQVPMSVIATWGLYEHIIPWMKDRLKSGSWGKLSRKIRLSRWVPIVFILMVIPTNLYLITWRITVLSRHDYPYYLNNEDVEALSWLNENTEEDSIVLSSYTIGHYIPGFTHNKPFLSNAVMTMDSHHKEEELASFFDSAAAEYEREQLIRRYDITYLFYGQSERNLGDYNPDNSPLFELVFESNLTRIYEIKHP